VITSDLWRLTHPNCIGAAYVGPLKLAERYRDGGHPYPAESYVMEREPCCQCCGYSSHMRGLTVWDNGQARCNRHHDRNPCAIEGCTRTNAVNGQYADDQWLCTVHWRIGCPPRSAMRRTYHRFFRRAKKLGWTDDSRASFWAFWNRLLVRARKRCAGDVDMNEVNRMFGWD
jgi:hypothetical protein